MKRPKRTILAPGYASPDQVRSVEWGPHPDDNDLLFYFETNNKVALHLHEPELLTLRDVLVRRLGPKRKSKCPDCGAGMVCELSCEYLCECGADLQGEVPYHTPDCEAK